VSNFFVSNAGQGRRIQNDEEFNGGEVELTEQALDQVAGGFAGPTFAAWLRPGPPSVDMNAVLAAAINGLFSHSY
jgi:hypothetical protein